MAAAVGGDDEPWSSMKGRHALIVCAVRLAPGWELESLLFRRGDPADLAQAIARAIALIDAMLRQAALLNTPCDRRTPASPSAR